MSSLSTAKKLIRDIKKNGYDAYLVGGVVRDFLMKSKFNDIDITTKAKPYEMMKIFKTVPTGIKYGTVTVMYDNEQFEVTTFRQDGPTLDFRHPDSVIYSDDVKDDVLRRDFTINGILMDEFQNIYDYVDGQKDIEAKLIRTIGDSDQRFNEDALRILRALYFQSKLGFEIEAETLAGMIRSKDLISKISMERVHQEVIKILKGPFAKMALKTLIDTGIHKELPGLEKGFIKALECEKMPFVDTFFTMSFALNNAVVPAKWPFSNLHRNKYQKAAELANKVHGLIDNVNLYHYGVEISQLANKANFYLGRSKFFENKIQELYDALPVKGDLDLALSSHEIINYLQKKQGIWLGNLRKEMINDVLLYKVENTKPALYKYLDAKKVNL